MKELHELAKSLRGREAEFRQASLKAAVPSAYDLFGKAEGIRISVEALEAAVKRLYGEAELADLAGETISIDAATGHIPPSEVFRIRLKYGVHLRGDYDFARTGEFRLIGGGKLVF